MKSLLENTKVLILITALFVACVILIGRTDVLFFNNFFVIGIVSLCIMGILIYRPMLGFALLISALPFEILNVLPENVGFSLRPYQILCVLLCLAIGGLCIRKNVSVTDVRAYATDAVVISLLVVSGVVVQWAQDSSEALRQTIILGSFTVIYFITRFFVREFHDAIKVLSITIVSGWVTSMYAIFQNILFLHGGDHQEFMPGRPNAFFAEPDWLGIYLVFVFAACLTYLYYNAHHKHVWKFFDVTLWGITATVVVATILTVARSAWLGMAMVGMLYVLILFVMRRYKMCAQHVLWLGSVITVSIMIATFLPITNFELDNRIQSTTGSQEITVSCVQEIGKEQLMTHGEIENVTELSAYGCRHINLEEINAEKAMGHSVTTVMRHDPNIAVRAKTYAHVVQLIQERPLTGYGWGSSGALLGTDEQGTPLNASNLFLETMLSIGIVGVGLLMLLFGIIALRSLIVMHRAHDEATRSVALFGLLGLGAILVPNFFNAGLFLGFVWMFLGMVAILCKKV